VREERLEFRVRAEVLLVLETKIDLQASVVMSVVLEEDSYFMGGRSCVGDETDTVLGKGTRPTLVWFSLPCCSYVNRSIR
jgi:hypothetical protein